MWRNGLGCWTFKGVSMENFFIHNKVNKLVDENENNNLFEEEKESFPNLTDKNKDLIQSDIWALILLFLCTE